MFNVRQILQIAFIELAQECSTLCVCVCLVCVSQAALCTYTGIRAKGCMNVNVSLHCRQVCLRPSTATRVSPCVCETLYGFIMGRRGGHAVIGFAVCGHCGQ